MNQYVQIGVRLLLQLAIWVTVLAKDRPGTTWHYFVVLVLTIVLCAWVDMA